MTTDPIGLLSSLLGYAEHDITARQFAPENDLVPLIQVGWLVPHGLASTALCEACDEAHLVNVFERDGMWQGLCLRTGEVLTVPDTALTYRVDTEAVAKALASAMKLDGDVRPIRGISSLWALGGRRLNDTRVVFYFTPNLDRLDLATSILEAVWKLSGPLTSALIVGSDAVDHVRLFPLRTTLIRLRDIASIGAGGKFSIYESQLIRIVLPQTEQPQRGRPPGQRDRILPILDELDAEGIQIDDSAETLHLLKDRFRLRHPEVSLPVDNTFKSATAHWEELRRGE